TVNARFTPVSDPPVVSVIAPATSPEGSPITATSSVSDPDTGDTASYAWTVTKNGAPYASGSGASITFTPNDNGAYVVSLTVTDGSNATGSDAKTVNVTNVAPAVTSVVLSATTIDENGSVTLSGTFTDPSSDDTHSVTIDWGDGASTALLAKGSRAFSLTHQYLDDAPSGTASDVFAVSVTVSDDDGDSGTAGTLITVKNVVPVISSVSGPTTPVALGGTATITVNYSDVGTLDTHTATINWDDGNTTTVSCAAGTCTASHTYAAVGVY